MNTSTFDWVLDSSLPNLNSDWFNGSIKTQQSSVEMALEKNEFLASPLSFLCAELNWNIGEQVDCYIRGNDLVLQFRSKAEKPLHTELYFRVVHVQQGLLAVESIISLHTHLLDLHPELLISSTCICPAISNVDTEPLTDILLPNTQAFCCGNLILSLTALPSDCKTSTINSNRINGNDQLRIQMEMHAGRLEKGVIRRMRVLGLICSSDNKSLLGDLIHQFENSAIPLTT